MVVMLQKFTKNVGFGMGLEFRESSYQLNAKNTKQVKEGMVLNVGMGFNNLDRTKFPNDSKKKSYALFIADTVVVQARGEPLVSP